LFLPLPRYCQKIQLAVGTEQQGMIAALGAWTAKHQQGKMAKTLREKQWQGFTGRGVNKDAARDVVALS